MAADLAPLPFAGARQPCGWCLTASATVRDRSEIPARLRTRKRGTDTLRRTTRSLVWDGARASAKPFLLNRSDT